MANRLPGSRSSAASRDRRSAFTLLELLTAIALVGLIGVAMFASLRIASKARESAEAKLEPARTADIVYETLRQDLENAQPPRGILCGAFTGTDFVDDRGHDGDQVLFFSTAPGAEHVSGDGEVRRIEYMIVSPDGQDGDHLLVRRVTHNLMSPFTPPYDDEVLLRSVDGFNIRYFDGISWYDSWDSSQTNTVPPIMEIALDIARNEKGVDGPVIHRFVRHLQLPCAVLQTDPSGLSSGGMGGR